MGNDNFRKKPRLLGVAERTVLNGKKCMGSRRVTLACISLLKGNRKGCKERKKD